MYPTLLTLHSLFRWLVVASLLITIYRAYRGWINGLSFSKSDTILRTITVTLIHIQLVFGLWLYFISPVVDYFLHNFKVALHERQIRFFGMEHSTMMLVGIIIITMGSSLSKRKYTDKEKFKTMAIWFSVGLFIVFTSIPWSFSPLVSRPYFRAF